MKTYPNIQSYNKRIKRLIEELDDSKDKPLTKTAKYMVREAVTEAPVMTGTLIQEIHWKTSNTGQAWLLQRNPGQKNKNWQGQPFNYAEAMRHPGKTRARIRRGDPDYMKIAARRGKKKFNKNVHAHVIRAIKTT